MLVDSHCHLDFPDFADDLDAIVARSEAAGVGRLVTISTRVRRLDFLLAIAERFSNVYCSVGTHPHHADEEDGISAEELIGLTQHPKVVALGEAGLDYFYQHGSRQAQERGFREHIAAARVTGLPLVIHTREADDDCGRILEDEMSKGSFRAVLHCYTGGRELAMKAIALGFSISFTGILTFKKSQRCAISPPSYLPIALWSRPMRRTWRQANFAASETSPPTWSRWPRFWRRPAECRLMKFRDKPPRTSSASFRRCHPRKRRDDTDADNSRLWILGRRTPSGARLGSMRSEKSKKSATSLFTAGGADSGSGNDESPGRHLSGSARAVDRCTGRPSRCGFSDCTSTPIRRTASTISGPSSCTSVGVFPSI